MEIPDEFLEGVIFEPDPIRERRANWFIVYFPELASHEESATAIESKLKFYKHTACFVFQLEKDKGEVRACIALTLVDGYRDPRPKLRKLLKGSYFYFVENIEIVRRYCLRTNARLTEPCFHGFSGEEETRYLNKYALITKRNRTPKELEALERSKELGLITDYDIKKLKEYLKTKRETLALRKWNCEHAKVEFEYNKKINLREDDEVFAELYAKKVISSEEYFFYLKEDCSRIEEEIHELLTDPYSPSGSPLASAKKVYPTKSKPAPINRDILREMIASKMKYEDVEKHPHRLERVPLENLARNRRDWEAMELEEEKQAIQVVDKLTEQEQIASIIKEQVGKAVQKPPITPLRRKVRIRIHNSD